MYVFYYICAYADTAEYSKKISDSIKIQVQIQPKQDSGLVLNVQNLKLDGDILFNENALHKNVGVIVSVATTKKNPKKVLAFMVVEHIYRLT